MARLPVLGAGDKIDQKHLPAHLDPATLTAVSTADKARANHTGTQVSTTISDFTEAVQDAVAALLTQGTGVTLTYSDAGNTLTVTSTGGGGAADPETVRDTIGAALLGLGNITVTLNDAADTITISTAATVNSTDAVLLARANHTGTQLASTVSDLTEAIGDAMNSILVTTGITKTYDDVGGTITLAGSGSSSVGIANLPAGSVILVNKSGSTWPARPTSRVDVTVMWRGADPSPAIVASGTTGMLDNVDIRLVIP